MTTKRDIAQALFDQLDQKDIQQRSSLQALPIEWSIYEDKKHQDVRYE